MKEGVLIYNPLNDRMAVRFGLNDFHEGLHCGTCLDVFINKRWKETRIEYGDGWYLVGIPTDRLDGLRVRM